MCKCKGYIIENPATGLEFYTVDHGEVVFRYEGWCFETYQLARFYIDKLTELGHRVITRKLTGIEN